MKTPEIDFWPPYTRAKTRSTDGEPRVRHEGQISTRWYSKDRQRRRFNRCHFSFRSATRGRLFLIQTKFAQAAPILVKNRHCEGGGRNYDCASGDQTRGPSEYQLLQRWVLRRRGIQDKWRLLGSKRETGARSRVRGGDSGDQRTY